MAGKKPGPAKGSGGRPRKPASKVATRADGYKRVTRGPKGDGTQVYAHREAAGVGGVKGSKSGKTGGVVDHKNRKRGDNRKSNLRVGSKAANNRNKGKK
jgi:hypothetical protein